MADRTDLTAELDAAEDIVTGRAESVATEWGVRWPGRRGGVHECDDEDTARLLAAHHDRAGIGGALVRRTVTYGPWEDVPASS
jgi:hypothetical protein